MINKENDPPLPYSNLSDQPNTDVSASEKIAVIVPVYNTAPYLSECLTSLAAQTHKNFVVFAVDDGSTDSSLEILHRFANLDARFLVCRKANGGVSSARNRALELIEEEGTFSIICFVDSDDIASSNLLSIYADGISRFKADFVAVGVQAFTKKGPVEEKNKKLHPPLLLEGEDIYSFVFATKSFESRTSPASSLFIGNVAIRAAIIRGQRFDESKNNGEDQAFIFHALLHVQRAVAFSDIAYRYRLRNSSLSHDPRLRTSDMHMYLSLMRRENELPQACWQVIETRAFDCWWQFLRLACEKNELDNRWAEFSDALKYMQKNCRTNALQKSSSKKRTAIFKLGKFSTILYFKFLRKNKSSSRKMSNAFD